MILPKISSTSDQEALGVRMVDAQISENLGHIFRETPKRDIGIDGELEIVDSGRRGTGRLIALQIKCGESFFKEADGGAFVFRGELKHLDYWIGHSLPVLILLCHPTDRLIYWVEVTAGAVTRLTAGWKILVPMLNVFSEAKWQIEEIGKRNQIDEVIDLSVQAWVHSSTIDRVEFAGMVAMPRDYHWYHHLMQIGEEQVMLHWLYARYGFFDIPELREVLRLLPGNLSYGSKLILCFIADSETIFKKEKAWEEICAGNPYVEVVRLIFDRKWSRMLQLLPEGIVIEEYYRGVPLDY